MTQIEFKILLQEIFNETVKLAMDKQIGVRQIGPELDYHGGNFGRPDNRTSTYDKDARCIAYALRYGIKTAYQTWLNLRNISAPNDFKKIVLLGGGCAFELPVLLKFLQPARNSFDVTIIDKYADDWQIFVNVHEALAAKMGINLKIEYVKDQHLVDQIDQYHPQLLVASNMLNEISDDEVRNLRVAFYRLPYLVQDLHPENLDFLFGEFEDTVMDRFPGVIIPREMQALKLHDNLERPGFCFRTRGLTKMEPVHAIAGNNIL